MSGMGGLEPRPGATPNDSTRPAVSPTTSAISTFALISTPASAATLPD